MTTTRAQPRSARHAIAALTIAGTLVLGACTSESTTSSPSTQPRTTPAKTTPAKTTPAKTTPAKTTESGDFDAGHGLTVTLPVGWTVSNIVNEDDGRLHTFTHAATGAELQLLTTDDADGQTPTELCEQAQDDLSDHFERNGAVTRTQGAAHSDNAHTCGLAATNAEGVAIEITIFAAVGTKAGFVTAAIFPVEVPQGVSQQALDQVVREASQMSSELLNDID